MRLINNSTLRKQLETLVAANPLTKVGRKSLFAAFGAGFGHVREVHDVAYGDKKKQRLDLYFPAGRTPHTALVFVHGGRWRSGDKNEYRYVGRALAERGFAVAVVGYRLFPEVRFPCFVHDVAQATCYLQQHNARLGWPDAPMWLCGHSAGAHIAALVGLEPAYSMPSQDLPLVAGVIGISGPYSFMPEYDPSLFPVFGTRHHRQWLSPMCPLDCVGAGKPPLLLIHGTDDKVVSFRGAQRMADQAKRQGQPVSLVSLNGQGHFQPVFSFHPAMPGHHHLVENIEKFCLGKHI